MAVNTQRFIIACASPVHRNPHTYGHAGDFTRTNTASRPKRRVASELWILDTGCNHGVRGEFNQPWPSALLHQRCLHLEASVNCCSRLYISGFYRFCHSYRCSLHVSSPILCIGVWSDVLRAADCRLPNRDRHPHLSSNDGESLSTRALYGFVSIQFILVFVYPAYEALFRAVEGARCQLLVILLLPVIKVAVKNMVLRCTRHLEDMMPEAATFTVDYFNAIYVATCMQCSTSATSIAAITITDLSQAMFMFYGLYRHTATILPRLGLIVKEVPRNRSLVASLSTLCRDSGALEEQLYASTNIRMRSSIPHQLFAVDDELLDKQEICRAAFCRPTTLDKALLSREVTESPCNDSVLNSWCARRRSNAIYPFTSSPVNSAEKKTILSEALETLFTTECLIVGAYLETVVPLLYGGYMLVMVHFPSAQYHAEMAGVTRENVGATVFPVFIFAVMQIASFALLGAVIKRNCGMRALWQLALVLESQMPLIQGKLMVWIMITLCFRLAHFGVDFTFKSVIA